MVITCWSSKGGAGTTVVATSLALTLAKVGGALTPRDRDLPDSGAILIDTSGDAAAVLGLPEPTGPGLVDWLRAGSEVPAEGLARLEVEVAPGLALLPRGTGELDHPDRAEVLAAICASESRHVVIDCGCLGGALVGSVDSKLRQLLASSATHSILVTRSCYLSLRRAVAAPVQASGAILVAEQGRSLRSEDVSAVLNIPVLTTVPWDSGIARAVDAGLLLSRMPRQLAKAIARAA